MSRGGKRTGTPGTPHPNRTDLDMPPVHFTDQTYGTQTAQVQAQQQVPIQKAPPIPAFVPLDAPTTRPFEPATHGLPSGPGAGPEALGVGLDDPLTAMRAAYAVYPDPDLMRAILDEEDRRG